MREARNDPGEFTRLDKQFHETIAAAARNALYLSLSIRSRAFSGLGTRRRFEQNGQRSSRSMRSSRRPFRTATSRPLAKRCGSTSSGPGIVSSEPWSSPDDPQAPILRSSIHQML